MPGFTQYEEDDPRNHPAIRSFRRMFPGAHWDDPVYSRRFLAGLANPERAQDDLDKQFPQFAQDNHSTDISRQQAAPPNNGPTPDSYASVVPALIKTLQQNHPDLPIWRDSVQLKGLSDDLRNRFTPKSPLGDLQRLRQSSNNSPTTGPKSVRQGDPDLEYLDGQQGAEAWRQQSKL